MCAKVLSTEKDKANHKNVFGYFVHVSCFKSKIYQSVRKSGKKKIVEDTFYNL